MAKMINNPLHSHSHTRTHIHPHTPQNIPTGLLMAKMINKAVPRTIDERALNKPKKVPSPSHSHSPSHSPTYSHSPSP